MAGKELERGKLQTIRREIVRVFIINSLLLNFYSKGGEERSKCDCDYDYDCDCDL